MKSITVFTEGYYKELDEYTVCFVKRAKNRRTRSIKLYYEEFDAAAMYHLLEWVCYQENPVLKNAPKLAAIVKDATAPAMREKGIQAIGAYAAENSALHVEGYVRFRMAVYNNYLNCLLYMIVKKLRMM